jgi:hypothetical protein
MKHLKSYQQINESKGSEPIKDILEKFSKKIDTKELVEFLQPYKMHIKKYYDKYVKDGVINADLIHSDFSRLNFTANEERGFRYGDEDYADEDNNPVLKFLYKLFVRWPKNFVTGLWHFFNETVIETFKDGGMGIVMGIFALAMWIATAILVFALGVFTYQFIEMEFNGLDHGKVESEVSFEPAHYEMTPHTMYIGKTTQTYYTNDYYPDAWHVEVEGEKGRIEKWGTGSERAANHARMGTEISKEDGWSWEWTEKK